MKAAPLRAFYPLALAAALLLALAPLTAVDASSMYRWVDNHGNVHFSDQRPSGRDAERVGSERHMGPAQAEEPPAEQAGTNDDQDRRQQQERYEQRMQEQEAQREQAETHNRELCERIQQEQARLQQGGRFRAPGEDGEPRFLSEEQRQERITNNQRMLEERC